MLLPLLLSANTMVLCCAPRALTKIILDTPMRGAAAMHYGESMTVAAWQDIEHSDPLYSQPICSKGLP